jgi:hypothetical protein
MSGGAYASGVADFSDAEWVVPLSPADILTLQQAPAGGGSLIDWGQP